MRVFITGVAGFIGFHVAQHLLANGHDVYGYDSINDYYDPAFKQARLRKLGAFDRFQFTQGMLEDAEDLRKAWDRFGPSHVLHLAAQAGVRYSLENPSAYISANIVGFQNVIEQARATRPENFVYASSSSVYGGNKELPFSEQQKIDNPVSLYAATKAANELVAKAYGNLFELPSTGLRFFTVYGPFSRPDMAMFKFAELMRQGQKIPVFNHGKMIRDFTYVDDIVSGVIASLAKRQIGKVYNLGKGAPMELSTMIKLLESNLGIKAELELLPMQLGDVHATTADISAAQADLGYAPRTDLATGIAQFASWYKEFRGLC